MFVLQFFVIYIFIVKDVTISETCPSQQITKGTNNEFNCTRNENSKIFCSLAKSSLKFNISLCDNKWKKKIKYDERFLGNRIDFPVKENVLKIPFRTNINYTFSVCSNNSQNINNTIHEIKINRTGSDKHDSRNCTRCHWREYKLIIHKSTTADNFNFHISDQKTDKILSFNRKNESSVYLHVPNKHFSWRLHKVETIEGNSTEDESIPCTMKLNHSGNLNVAVTAFLENSSLDISLNNQTKTSKQKRMGKWQQINLQINAVNETTFSIKGNLLNNSTRGFWAISEIKIFTNRTENICSEKFNNLTLLKNDPSIQDNTTSSLLATSNTTNQKDTTTPKNKNNTTSSNQTATKTTQTSKDRKSHANNLGHHKSPPVSYTEREESTTTATTNEPNNTTSSLLATSNTTSQEDTTTPKNENNTTSSNQTATKTTQTPEDRTSHATDKTPDSTTNATENEPQDNLATFILLFLIILAFLFLGYLAYAYKFQKYPFDLARIPTLSVEDASPKEMREFSDYYKTTKIRTVRSKAAPPPNETELEVLIDPAKKANDLNLTSLPIKIDEFEKYLMVSLGDDAYSNELTKQYRKIQTKVQKPTTVGSQPKNDCKNRYNNLIPYDETRVILKDTVKSDYINANYIDGFENRKAFIATQAPLKSTLGDFWWMIWQEKVHLIIMLTELVESGLTKCEQYWPEINQKIRFGRILIELVSTNLFSDYTERNFSVKCDEETRIVQQLQYITWPDHGVPLYPQNFTPFMKRLLLVPQQEAPIVVHCNAGCGRTGTLILCDIILRMAAKEKTIDFVKVLKRIREQRINLVNNVNQYVFAHFVILECLFGIDFSIPINDSFQNEVNKVLRKITIKPMMEQLDKVTEQFKKRQISFKPIMSNEDKKKNRFSDILPGHAQLYLPMSSENSSNYINAVVVDCYRCPKKFIVTQQPLPNTVDDFWSLIKEYEVNTIVSLNEIEENDEDCPKFWIPQNSTTKLQIMEETENRVFYLTKIKIANDSDESLEKTVNILRMRNWTKDMSYPPRTNDLIVFANEMFKTSWKATSQIVVTCYDGATASGLFVALAYLLEKIKYEQVCDVFSAIRTVRQNREQFVQEWGQMEFLYKAAKAYIEEFENYDNFN